MPNLLLLTACKGNCRDEMQMSL